MLIVLVAGARTGGTCSRGAARRESISRYRRLTIDASSHEAQTFLPDRHRRGTSIKTMSDCSCTCSTTISRPSAEMSKSRTVKSGPKSVNCRSAPVAKSISQRFLCAHLAAQHRQASGPRGGRPHVARRASVSTRAVAKPSPFGCHRLHSEMSSRRRVPSRRPRPVRRPGRIARVLLYERMRVRRRPEAR